MPGKVNEKMSGKTPKDFIVGQRVQWDHPRNNPRILTGTIVSVGWKYVHIRMDDARLVSLKSPLLDGLTEAAS